MSDQGTRSEDYDERRDGSRRQSDREVQARATVAEGRSRNTQGLLWKLLCIYAVFITFMVLAVVALQLDDNRTSHRADRAATTAEHAQNQADADLATLKNNVYLGCFRNNQKIRQDDLNAEAEYTGLTSLPPELLVTLPKLEKAAHDLSWIATVDCNAAVPRVGANYTYPAPVPFSVRLPTSKDLVIGKPGDRSKAGG